LKGLYIAWTALTLYVCILAFLFFFRFLAGKWENMRVIETTPQNIPRNIPPVPTFETDLIDR
jgi:hypothetical protein